MQSFCEDIHWLFLVRIRRVPDTHLIACKSELLNVYQLIAKWDESNRVSKWELFVFRTMIMILSLEINTTENVFKLRYIFIYVCTASCEGDFNATSGCGNHCGQSCSDYNEVNKTCMSGCRYNSCDCKEGFVYHDTLQRCVLPIDCCKYIIGMKYLIL